MSRAALYQTQLGGYVRISKKIRTSTSANGVTDVDVSSVEVPTFESKDWYPINVDSGSTAKDAISVEAWTTLSEASGSLADGPAGPLSSEVWAQARADPPWDNAYEMELADTIKEGLVKPPEDVASEGLYIWEGVVFAMEED
ncbi:hypothetical protein C8J57DRAFT_1504097 [Mycena rebaudengoi]|nr:hypothetical protein C8J57DRAFT_1504097 [Mycena rebaudengoi]